MDRPTLFGLHRSRLVDGPAQDVHHPAQGGGPHRHGDGGAGAGYLHAPLESVRGAHGDAAHRAVAGMLLHLQGQLAIHQLQGVVDLGQVLRLEVHVHHRADDLHDPANTRGLTHGCAYSLSIAIRYPGPPPALSIGRG